MCHFVFLFCVSCLLSFGEIKIYILQSNNVEKSKNILPIELFFEIAQTQSNHLPVFIQSFHSFTFVSESEVIM